MEIQLNFCLRTLQDADVSILYKNPEFLVLENHGSGAPQLARLPRPGPCLDFGFQYDLIRNHWSKKLGVEYWALPGTNSLWRPCFSVVVI